MYAVDSHYYPTGMAIALYLRILSGRIVRTRCPFPSSVNATIAYVGPATNALLPSASDDHRPHILIPRYLVERR